MAVAPKGGVEALFADKKVIQETVARQMAQMGIEKDPTATPHKARQMMLERGIIRPEDNEFSRAIIAAREE